MSSSISVFPNSVNVTQPLTVTRPATIDQAAGVPWYLWCGVAAVTSASIGGNWDVAWHRSIGRDSFWTPAHMAIYACGLLAAVICGYLIFATTFGRSERMRDVSVGVLGFRAPVGAFLAAWGGLAMMVSAPFDNWWHAAYGLDVKIVSPPHTLLILGIRCVGLGMIFLILAAMNRAQAGSSEHRTLQRMFLYLGGLTVGGQMFFILQSTWEGAMHSALPYELIAASIPVVLAVLWRASGARWACTTATAIYMTMMIAEILIFPLFPASPKLGPVYFPVTHLVPGKFPILLVVPALALDLLWQRTRTWKTWQVALVTGVVFTAVLVAVEWPFASFLLTKASENRFFGTIYFDYNSRPDGPDRMREWFNPMSGTILARGLALAVAYGSVGTWLGMRFGNWMRGVQR